MTWQRSAEQRGIRGLGVVGLNWGLIGFHPGHGSARDGVEQAVTVVQFELDQLASQGFMDRLVSGVLASHARHLRKHSIDHDRFAASKAVHGVDQPS